MTTKVRLGGTLVGMHFRPPASDVVNLLPSGQAMILQRQPENQYDTNAVQVLLPGFAKDGELSHIWQQFANDALDDEELLGRLQNPLWLGFVCNSDKTGGKKADPIAKIMDDAGIMQIKAWLVFNAKGNAEVETDCEEHREEELEVEEEICDEEDDLPQADRDRFPEGQ